ncbi:hypothetical protein L227DRAFT_120248 [Lentinus tigrinus ALCF2SS1-6]|uniref:Uncharacterized protein n=1 Tax=Lentinus tigrinus ALCF2SS1-6 TaxID=1328759 RepID=A0A5C2SQZ8_9APHY|nr:hypothetical protein L227DRAFT_120248 [Lentinus tigrinus ALCF2SS1-6]
MSSISDGSSTTKWRYWASPEQSILGPELPEILPRTTLPPMQGTIAGNRIIPIYITSAGRWQPVTSGRNLIPERSTMGMNDVYFNSHINKDCLRLRERWR